jgi:alkane 1-monooxygenase
VETLVTDVINPATVSDDDTRPWKDPKRVAWVSGLMVPALPFTGWAIATVTSLDVFFWNGPLWLLVLMPLLDSVRGLDDSNPPDSAMPALDADRYYRWLTYLFVPIQYVSFVWACWYVTQRNPGTFATIGITFTVGMVSGIAIAAAHELGHKREQVERRLAKFALAPSAYGHFYVEHNKGHHVRVATPEDPASARLGESFWAFVPRTVGGSMRSAWRIEMMRLRRKGQHWWSPRNNILNAWAITVVLFGAMIVLFGATVIPFLAVQAAIGFMLLEVVNYIEHYGLLRRTLPDGRVERCLPEHSWNANHIASNVALYHLERHSDHHAYPARRYQCLRDFPEAPQLPHGYAGMIRLAIMPPLWRRAMDQRVVDHYDGDVTRANIQPRKRATYLARYAANT